MRKRDGRRDNTHTEGGNVGDHPKQPLTASRPPLTNDTFTSTQIIPTVSCFRPPTELRPILIEIDQVGRSQMNCSSLV